MFKLAQSVPTECGSDSAVDQCAASFLGAFTILWQGPVGNLANLLILPPGWADALLVFASLLGLAWFTQRGLAREASGDGGETTFGKVGFLLLSITAALYFCITAIVAIPVFSDRTSKLEDDKRLLADELPKRVSSYADRVEKLPKFVPLIVPGFTELRPKVEQLWATTGGSFPRTNAAGDTIVTQQVYKQTLTTAVDGIQWQIGIRDQQSDEFNRARQDFRDRAEEFVGSVIAWLVRENTGHLSGHLTDQHAALLISRSDLWMAGYHRRLEACRTALVGTAQDISRQVAAVEKELSIPRTETDAPGPPREFILGQPQAFIPAQELSSNTQEQYPCTQIAVDPERDALPPRPGPGQELGVFWTATHWLLATESVDLALIIGLLGFGFFGALTTSFIRQFAHTEGTALPSSGWIIPALVRGVAAAILVFLAVQGGIAVFAQSGQAPSPNPYAVFLACFVAAVFSEEVWALALDRVREQAGEKGRKAEQTRAADVADTQQQTTSKSTAAAG